ncbi:MAG TPA: RluA family pseudouridine synthase [Firmicutes bacterium]|nr:RluA family pseudouridine synthase [Bacillota bacterium]
MENNRHFVVANDQVGLRLDKFLASVVTDLSRSRLEFLIERGHILVNDKASKPAYKLRLNDEIDVVIPPLEDDPHESREVPFSVIYEDEDIIIVNKPVGVVTHPAPGHTADTLVNGLLYRYPNLSGINGVKRPGIVHRLDKDTSGLLVVARNDAAHQYLAKQLSNHSMYREYVALVEGPISEQEGRIEAPIGRDLRFRTKMSVNVHEGRLAITHFNVMTRYNGYTLLSLRLETGRTHQIRVHLAYIGHPIVGDVTYGGKADLYNNGQLLHALKLTLRHPKTKALLTFEAPLPNHFKDVLKKLES